MIYSCIPDGGATSSAMTELQPSPSGYRGQDEVPGPPICSPGGFSKSYPNHGHPAETSNYGGIGPFSHENSYLLQHQQHNNKQQQQNASRGSSPGEQYYRRKTDRRTSENENNVGDNIGKKSTTITSYNEGYKKNTFGYKNDSG